MTVTYTGDVASARFGMFLRLIFRWRGSLWKAVYLELLFWCACYAAISLVYRFAMDLESQTVFERYCAYFKKHKDFLPLTFMLGFYVSIVVARWWTMYANSGWIDYAALYVRNYIRGDSEEMQIQKRNIIRHLLLAQILVYRDISISVRKRFPTLSTLIAAGYLTEEELRGYDDVAAK